MKNATVLVDDFCRVGIAVEVTRRSKRRLFGLAGVTPLRNAVAPPYRPDAQRGRGRPPLLREVPVAPPPVLPPAPPIKRQAFDYSLLESAVTQLGQKVGETRPHSRSW